MDYSKLHLEYEQMILYSKSSIDTLKNINSYYKSIATYGELFTINTKKTLDEFFEEQTKIDTKSSMAKNLLEFYQYYEDYIIRSTQILSKVNAEIVDPLNVFHQNLSESYNENLLNFKNIIEDILNAKKRLEKIQQKYYNSCRTAKEMEKTIGEPSGEFVSLDKQKEKEKHIDTLTKLRAISENFSEYYKYELKNANKIIEENEIKYQMLASKRQICEEKRILFVKEALEKFTKIYEEFSQCCCNFLKKLNSTIVEIKCEEDIKLFNEKFSYNRNESHLKKEHFISFEELDQQCQTSIHTEASSNFEDALSSDSKVSSYSEEYQNELIEEFLLQLQSDNEIEADLMGKMMNVLCTNSFFPKKFFDSLLKDRMNFFIRLTNLKNLHHLGNIFSTISLNVDSNTSVNPDFHFSIIFIAERIYYQRGDQIIYLCALLCKNKFLMTKSYWVNLIELKLAKKLEEHITRLIKIEHIPIPQKSSKEESSMNTSASSEPGKGFFSSIGLTLKKIFTKDMRMRDSLLLKYSKAVMLIKNFEMLEEYKYPVLNKITTSEIFTIIKDFIPHMVSFNLKHSEMIDMIVGMSTQFQLSKEKINYFITYLGSSSYSIRRQSRESFAIEDSKRKDEKCKRKVQYKAIAYLSSEDFVNLMCVNTHYRKQVYKNLLKRNDLTMVERLGIWKCLLKTKAIATVVKYQDIVAILEEKKLKEEKASQDIIDLDVQRTYFEERTEESRAAIASVLKAITMVIPNLSYCQGMNYIASFIFQITKDEEMTFYILMGLFQSTEFYVIFMEDLHKLKVLFYVFERLLALYFPELAGYFKANGVVVNYFCSPWFITLFTCAYPFINISSHSKVLVKIWDDFIIHGWKSLMKTGLTLVKVFESELMTMKYEELLHFLINDMIKSDLFLNSNYDKYVDTYKKIRIKNKLIESLESEFIQEFKIREMDEPHKMRAQK